MQSGKCRRDCARTARKGERADPAFVRDKQDAPPVKPFFVIIKKKKKKKREGRGGPFALSDRREGGRRKVSILVLAGASKKPELNELSLRMLNSQKEKKKGSRPGRCRESGGRGQSERPRRAGWNFSLFKESKRGVRADLQFRRGKKGGRGMTTARVYCGTQSANRIPTSRGGVKRMDCVSLDQEGSGISNTSSPAK